MVSGRVRYYRGDRPLRRRATARRRSQRFHGGTFALQRAGRART